MKKFVLGGICGALVTLVIAAIIEVFSPGSFGILSPMAKYSVKYLESYNPRYIALFVAVFVPALVIDQKSHGKGPVSITSAWLWTGIWIFVTWAFAYPTAMMLGQEKASLYLTGSTLEKMLAIDNLVAFIAVFACFGLNASDKGAIMYRVLHWGVLGAIGARFVMLGALGFVANLEGLVGRILIGSMGFVVLYTAWKSWKGLKDDEGEEAVDYTQHFSVRWTKALFPVEPSLANGKFFVTKVIDGRKVTHATVTFLCLVCVEAVDVLFAFDSMPTIAAVVKDPNVMFTGTIMAVAGLRSLFFAVEALRRVLTRLDEAIVALLVYLSFKLISSGFGLEIGPTLNLCIVIAFLMLGVIASFVYPKTEAKPSGDIGGASTPPPQNVHPAIAISTTEPQGPHSQTAVPAFMRE